MLISKRRKVFKCRPGQNRKAAAVAADALWQLQVGRISPNHCYLASDRYSNAVTPEHFKQRKPVCEACAIGGLMVAYLRKFDVGWVERNTLRPEFGLVAPMSKSTIHDQLSSVFTEDLLEAAEAVYEWTNSATSNPALVEFEAAAAPNLNPGETRDRAVLSAIYRNIVANNGDFRPATGIHPEIRVKLVKGKVKVFRKRRK